MKAHLEQVSNRLRTLARASMVGLASTCSCAEPPAEQPGLSAAVTVKGTAKWRGGAQAAYTLGHDDACEPATSGLFTYAQPELQQRNLRAAFGAIVSTCDRLNRWAELNGLLADGHEILNHSWGHRNLVSDTREYGLEIANAKARLDAELIRPTEFFIFPFDDFDTEAVQAVRSTGHTGARAGTRGVNDANFDEFAVRFDVYGAEFSIYADDPTKNQNVLNALVDDALAVGGWAFRELHGVEDASWEAVPLLAYQSHLDYLKTLVDANILWVEGPSAVTRYRRATRLCDPPVSDGSLLKFPTPSPECAALETSISVLLSVDGELASLSVEQDQVVQQARKLASGEYVVDLSPTRGTGTLRAD